MSADTLEQQQLAKHKGNEEKKKKGKEKMNNMRNDEALPSLYSAPDRIMCFTTPSLPLSHEYCTYRFWHRHK